MARRRRTARQSARDAVRMFGLGEPEPRDVLVVDGSNLVARYSHVFSKLTAPDGVFTGGLYGAFDEICRLINDKLFGEVAGVVVCLDAGVPSFRFETYPAYKQNRGKDKKQAKFRALIRGQMKRLQRFLSPLGVVFASKPAWEADDVAAYLCKFGLPKHPVLLATGDQDWSQLVREKEPRRRHYLPQQQDIVTKRPGRFVLRRALYGDPSDNVKGVPGIGPTKASAVLAAYPEAKTPKQLAKALQGDTGPERVILDHQEDFRACYRVMNLSYSAKLLYEAGGVDVSPVKVDLKRFRKKVRRYGMGSIDGMFEDSVQPFELAHANAVEDGVFSALGA